VTGLCTLEEALALRAGKRLVTTNGVFDILHAGHVALLEHARSLGDLLVVALNSDASARRLGKGEGRPVHTLADRAQVVAALRAVDAVVSFEEPDPVAVLSVLRPEVHVKGGDYDPAALPESPAVLSWGGRVEIVPYLEGRSTTRIVEAVRAMGSED
jgi:rfaE bifunctional protein nucleotidyltransferase chain/domain